MRKFWLIDLDRGPATIFGAHLLSIGRKIDRAQVGSQKKHADFDRKRVVYLEHFLEVF